MNDPRLTAYALGELAGDERAKFETLLAGDPALAAELEATSAICAEIERHGAPPDALDAPGRARLLAACREEIAQRRRRGTRKPAAIVALAALAAALAVAPLLPWAQWVGSQPQSSELAQEAVPAATPVEPGFVAGRELDAAVALQQPVDSGLAELDRHIDAQLEGINRDGLEAARMAAGQAGASVTASTGPAERSVLTVNGEVKAVGDPAAESSVATAGRVRVFTGGWGIGTGAGVGVAPVGKFRTEAYDAVEPGVFLDAAINPLSTFSIDADTASYANVRRMLGEGALPPAGAVRVEEFINYFRYALPAPQHGEAFSVTTDAAPAPWNPEHLLVRIALRGRDLPAQARPPSNLVFLVDVSGSMQPDNKLPLLVRSLDALVGQLGPNDRVAIVTYAGDSGLALAPTSDKAAIREALEALRAGGSTNGAGGIGLAYETARAHFLPEGNNRVILCTDGDFNVGVTSQSDLVELIERERASGVFLSVLGFGTGNLKDSTMEKLADKGNGNYAYIDSIAEGRKVLVEEMAGTLFTIAKDVKVQVEFNPARVAGYRLLGYENRTLAKEDFNNDAKDAGEIGAGHAVTAFYEVAPAGKPLPGTPSVDPLKYQEAPRRAREGSEELLTVKLRYKAPDADRSSLLERPLAAARPLAETTADFRFAAAAAAFAMKLRGNPDFTMSWDEIARLARGALGEDPGSLRAEFLTLVEKAKALEPQVEAPSRE